MKTAWQASNSIHIIILVTYSGIYSTRYWRWNSTGILLCLCSKNNPEDVDDVLNNHTYAVLKNEHLVVKKVNWLDKVSNLKALATELNLGLDCFIFIDDASFEVEAVHSQLPMVRVFQVPKHLPDYPAMLSEVQNRALSVRGRHCGKPLEDATISPVNR